MMRKIFTFFLILGCCAFLLGLTQFSHHAIPSRTFFPTVRVNKQCFLVDIKTTGELEAAHSTIVSSSIKGDLGKIIEIIPDGASVEPGQLLVRMDPTPFEEKIEKLRLQMKEHHDVIVSLEQSLEWESCQAMHENRLALYEVEAAQLELDKIIHGDGPQEVSRLKGALQKAWLKYDELNAYSNDLLELEKQGFLNPVEVKQAQKKLGEEKEAYETSKIQYDSYIQHVLPMQIKKGEMHLKRAQIKQEEAAKAGTYKVEKASLLLEQAKQTLGDYKRQLREARRELFQTEMIAPTKGMVVHREDYRSGQRRKPRVGDILVKNQPLIDLPDLSSMVVKTRIRELDLHKICIGKKATVEVDAYPQLEFEGTISSIGVLALTDLSRNGEEKFFELRIALDISSPFLRPGMTARATIHAHQIQDSLSIPLHSVFNEGKQDYCYVYLPDNTYEKRFIHLGRGNEHFVEVVKGLQEGELVSLLNPFQEIP